MNQIIGTRSPNRCAPPRRTLQAAAAVLALAQPHGAGAMEIDAGNPDIAMRWDNTLRYNLGTRIDKREPLIANSVVSDDGDMRFDKNNVVANRIDLLSEFDVVYRKRMGARLSAAGWYDDAYRKGPKNNPALAVPPAPAFGPFPPLRDALPNDGQFASYDNGQYSSYVKRYYRGPSGELLDAFVFGTFDVGTVPVTAKLGRHTVYWGESLLLGGAIHGVSYAQMPIDLQKGFATPGAEAKELFRPLNSLSAQAQITPELSLAGQYFLQWESFRYPEGGTFLGPVDFVFNGPVRQIALQPLSPTLTGVLNLARGGEARPKDRGEWGLSARWSPEWLDGTLGLYYREFADKLPQVFVTGLNQSQPFYVNGATPADATLIGLNGSYQLIYADKIKLLGASLSKTVGGVSLGAELSYRKNMPLNSQVLGLAAGVPFGRGETPGARGDTWHGVLNVIGLLPKTPLFDTASYAAELTWNRWSRVTSGAAYFNAIGFAPCADKDKWDGCSTKDFVGLAINFTPTWFQVFPGADLSMPVSYSTGISGNSAVAFGGNEGNGSYSIGLSLDYQQRYRFDLKYVDFFGRTKDNGAFVTSQNGFTTLLKDRGAIYVTFKTTF
jgi:hypothetical protein